MPHVSKRKLDPEISEKIFEKLVGALKHAHNNKILGSVLDELFTSTEKIMLAKRLSIIFMLSGNTPQHRIAEIMKVSPTTVTKLSLGVELDKFRTIIKISKAEKIDLEKIVWLLLTAGGIMPPRIGRKYWRKYK